MERIHELVLIIGIIFLSAYTIKVSQQSIMEVEKMNQNIQMMFVKS